VTDYYRGLLGHGDPADHDLSHLTGERWMNFVSRCPISAYRLRIYLLWMCVTRSPFDPDNMPSLFEMCKIFQMRSQPPSEEYTVGAGAATGGHIVVFSKADNMTTACERVVFNHFVPVEAKHYHVHYVCVHGAHGVVGDHAHILTAREYYTEFIKRMAQQIRNIHRSRRTNANGTRVAKDVRLICTSTPPPRACEFSDLSDAYLYARVAFVLMQQGACIVPESPMELNDLAFMQAEAARKPFFNILSRLNHANVHDDNILNFFPPSVSYPEPR
jgi:hypothetical protein